MSIGSSSTLAEVQAEYDDTASYAETDDLNKCVRFQTACRILMRRQFRSTSGAGLGVVSNMDMIAKELENAHQWLHEHGAGEGFDVLYPGQAT